MRATTKADPGLDEVEAAVRAVLAPLLAARRPAGPVARPAGIEVFGGKLLSVRTAEGFVGATRVVRVTPGTVVTPLARDFLKRQGIEIRWASEAEVSRANARGVFGFAADTRSGMVEAIRRHWLDGENAWHDLAGEPGGAAAWVSASADRGALVLTDEAAVLVYRACQVPGVRAAEACDAEAAARAVRSLGVNLLAVEPAGKPLGLIRQIGATFRRGGAPVPPDWYVLDERGRA